MSFEVEYEKCEGKAVQAALHCLELAAVHRMALKENAEPPCSPAEQLALLRAQKGTKRTGSGMLCVHGSGLSCLTLEGKRLPCRP